MNHLICRLSCAFSASLLLGLGHGAQAQQPSGVAISRSQSAVPTDFSGVWESVGVDFVLIPEASGQLTPEAQRWADLAEGKTDTDRDDPARFCLAKGMPWTMLIRARTYPVEIVQYPDRLFMTFELYDMFRNIRVGGPAMPEGYPSSPNGWSTARWEGKALVIETTGLPEVSPLGRFQRSEATRITERWTLRDDPKLGQVIDVDMTIEDPAIYAVPAKARQVLKRSAPGTVPGGYNCTLSQWNDYVVTRNKELEIGE